MDQDRIDGAFKDISIQEASREDDLTHIVEWVVSGGGGLFSAQFLGEELDAISVELASRYGLSPEEASRAVELSIKRIANEQTGEETS